MELVHENEVLNRDGKRVGQVIFVDCNEFGMLPVIHYGEKEERTIFGIIRQAKKNYKTRANRDMRRSVRNCEEPTNAATATVSNTPVNTTLPSEEPISSPIRDSDGSDVGNNSNPSNVQKLSDYSSNILLTGICFNKNVLAQLRKSSFGTDLKIGTCVDEGGAQISEAVARDTFRAAMITTITKCILFINATIICVKMLMTGIQI